MNFFRTGIVFLILWISGSFMISPESGTSADKTYTLSILVKNVRNKKGRIQLQVYRNQSSFAAETPWKQVYIYKNKMKGDKLAYEIKGLKPGIYGVALLDDEDNDKKMDYSWLIPSEGFGFSNYYHTAWSKPKFHQFKFNLSADKLVSMTIRYM